MRLVEARTRMDTYDRHMLCFALAWAPYGGPPDDETFCEFGLTPEALLQRVRTICAAAATRERHLPAPDRTLLARVRHACLDDEAGIRRVAPMVGRQLHGHSRPLPVALRGAGPVPAVSAGLDADDRRGQLRQTPSRMG
jgi:hypothetical protein